MSGATACSIKNINNALFIVKLVKPTISRYNR